MTQSFISRRRQILEIRLKQLYEDYEAVYAQIGRTISDTDILRLKRQASHIEQEIKQLETDILQLEPDRTQTRPVDVDNKGHQQLLVNMTIIFTQRFDHEELRTFCFHLDVDYDDLPAEGRASKARELVKYLNRHNRIKEAIALGRSLRPDIEWDRLLTA